MGALPHTVGGYRLQQRVKQRDHDRPLSDDQRGGKAVDGLQSTVDAELTGAQSLAQGRPYQDRADQMIGQHIHPPFLPHHRRGSASQHVHAKSHLDRSQGELTVPALALEVRHVVSAVNHCVKQGRHHHEHRGAKPTSPHTHTQLPHRQLIGEPRLGWLIHPRWRDRLAPLHALLLTAHALATAKVRRAAMGLAPHRVQTLPTQPRDGPVRTVIPLSQHDIATRSVALVLSKQGHFTCHFALIAPHSERRQGATAQGKDRHHARQRETSTGLLAPWWRIGFLIGLGSGP